MTRTCSHSGCTGAPASRGMCKKHYRRWQVTAPAIAMNPETRAKILATLPATQAELLVATSMTSQTISRYIRRLRADGEMHIGRHRAPKFNGERFRPIFVAGPGIDAVVTAKRKRQQMLKTERVGRQRRRLEARSNQVAIAAVKAHSWAAALMVGL